MSDGSTDTTRHATPCHTSTTTFTTDHDYYYYHYFFSAYYHCKQHQRNEV